MEDNLAGDPKAGAGNGKEPPSQTVCAALETARGGSGPCGRRGRRARSRAGLPLLAASGLSKYVRVNVLPRPGPAQPPPQIRGRSSDVERLLDEAGQFSKWILFYLRGFQLVRPASCKEFEV